jgi:hypothetical protein
MMDMGFIGSIHRILEVYPASAKTYFFRPPWANWCIKFRAIS